MYKSSSLTIFFKYAFPVLCLGSIVFISIMMRSHGSEEEQAFLKAFWSVAVWGSLILLRSMYQIQNVIANEDSLIVKRKGVEKRINYQDIEWLANYDLSCPLGVTVKYKDRLSGTTKKVSFIPDNKDKKVFANDAMSQYIVSMIPSSENQPSKTRNMAVLFALGLPFMLLAVYFILQSVEIL